MSSATSRATGDRLAAPGDRRWLVLVVVAIAQLMVVLDRTRGGAYVAVFISGIAIFATFLFLTYYLQEVKGESPLTTGLLFLPMVGCILISSNSSSIALLPRLGPRVLIAAGMLLGAAGMAFEAIPVALCSCSPVVTAVPGRAAAPIGG